ncbi:Cytochrome b561 and DOMON domain-containing protein [Quillaja saponaria]|uniref:Cytochrome b561 and DOMON domain-containing protein n=1 Tax=Quillaja saponaria TaxID=32244 RepID=A0AAD7PMJ6_QUISA|nr:Cytochrome b561 and DOMON domain-containing protein [Quillaja saponaria]
MVFQLVLLFLSSLPHIAFSAHCTTTTATKTFQKYITLPTQQASIAWTFHPHNATLDLVFFGYSPTIHPTTANDLSSITTFDVLSDSSGTHHRDTNTLRLVHGIINAISWGILLPIGAVLARYLRHIQVLSPAWFYAHASIQLLAFFLGTTGFAIGIRLGDLSPGVQYELHRKLGLAAFCLGGLQTLALLFRPKTTNKFRKYWKSYHHFVGYACVVLGVVNVFQGFEVMGASRSYAKLSYCLGLSTLVGVCVALEVNSWVVFCRKSKEEKMKREGLIGGSDKGSGIHS